MGVGVKENIGKLKMRYVKRLLFINDSSKQQVVFERSSVAIYKV